jgi:hypothetical protein
MEWVVSPSGATFYPTAYLYPAPKAELRPPAGRPSWNRGSSSLQQRRIDRQIAERARTAVPNPPTTRPTGGSLLGQRNVQRAIAERARSTPITPKIPTPSRIRTVPGVRLPNLPRNPFLNARWPKWARIPPKLRLPTAYLTGAGLGMLRPTLPDLLFGYIPDAMEASRPWVYERLGIQDPTASNLATQGHCAALYQVYVVAPNFNGGNEFPVGPMYGPITTDIYIGSTDGTGRPVYFFNAAGNPFSIGSGESYDKGVSITRVERIDGSPDNCIPPSAGGDGVATMPPGGGAELNLLDLIPGFNRGNQPSTPVAPGIPANQPGARPATDPRGYRRDLSPTSPGVSTSPSPQPDPTTPKPDPNATSCRFNPTDQAGIDALKNRIQNLEQENRRLQEALQSANQATYYSVPYVVEDASGKRVKQQYGLSLKGLVDTTAVSALSNQTADWALQQGQNATTQRIYQILGGDSMWGNKPQPEHETNPDEAHYDKHR